MPRTLIALGVMMLLALVTALATGQPSSLSTEAAGSYAICSVEKGAVMLDTRSGKAWVLHPSADKLRPATWLPTTRIDNLEEAAVWLKAEQERGATAREKSWLQRQLSDLKDRQRRLLEVNTPGTGADNLEKQIAEIEAKLQAMQ
jgi:hypothetical protein